MHNPERMIGEHFYEYSMPRNLLYAAWDDDGRYHPTQKPIELFEYLIKTYTNPGELVFDPCVGSGTTALACRNTNRRYIVGDLSAEYVAVANRRLSQPFTPNMFDTLLAASE